MYTFDQLALIWLAFSESLTFKGRERLMDHFGTAQKAFNAWGSKAYDLVGPKACEELTALHKRGLSGMQAILEQSDIQAVFREDDNYPMLLNEITDAPEVLFYRGAMEKADERAVAIIGSRRETRYGREQAFKIARDLAQNGVTVVSGLAYGIDTAAHLGALDGSGRTIAVLGSGLNRIYPKDNIPLADKIIRSGGAVISELPPESEPLAYHFPVRNRIVSGLVHGVLLIEAREKSGTMITVGHALTQGRDVFALPGPVDAPGSVVPHRFLREGARLCTCANDILEDMGWQSREMQMMMPGVAADLDDLTPVQRSIYDSLSDEVRSFEDVMSLNDLSPGDLNAHITMLEIRGLIESLPGRIYRMKRN
ncbi:MAG: DNA-processing protein DprA [Eubacteriales bacterium]|jgi:DNA processing protein|nr:DNA-processing protein DprA [Eubacteriales bacterium]